MSTDDRSQSRSDGPVEGEFAGPAKAGHYVSQGPARAGHYAVDIAILPPPDVSQRAVALSAGLPLEESQGLQLGPEYLPHITLTQQFISRDALDEAIAHVDVVLRDQQPLSLRVVGGARGSNSVWMAIERTAEIVQLHERVLHATTAFETADGDASAFFGVDARERDVRWVREFRRESGFARFTPHITIGHASAPPFVEPIDFVATRIAMCHLGRFCSCRRIIREWDLAGRR
jgi:2'-5' RNA ligase